MENNELNSMIRGYIAGNVVSNSLNNEIQKQINAIEEWESHHPYSKTINESLSKFILSKDFDGGYKYLNGLVMDEYVHYEQHQDKSQFAIEKLVGIVKTKYAEYYARLNKEMPKELASIDAQKLCEAVGVPILRTVDATDSEFKEEGIARGEERSTTSIVLCAIVIIGLIVAAIALSF